MKCSRCESLPQVQSNPGRLYLWAPLQHTSAKLLPWVRSTGTKHELRLEDECLVLELTLPESQLPELCENMTPEELRGTRSLFVEAEASAEGWRYREPGFSDFPRVAPLEQLASRFRSRWLLELLEQDRLTSFFHPIVSAADPSRVFAHEALMRGRGTDGKLISPAQILEAARSSGLLFQIDRAARLAAIRESVACDLSSRIFINFTPTAIYDPVNCLQSTVAAIQALNLPPERFVFEVVESEEVDNVEHLATILDFYRKSGFGVALDDLGAGYASLNRMAELRPDYVKLDMKLIQGVHRDGFKATIARRLLEMARELGIKTVVEGVEEIGELVWSQEHGADYVQGFLIARPANPPQIPAKLEGLKA